jgi:hypothetical protein
MVNPPDKAAVILQSNETKRALAFDPLHTIFGSLIVNVMKVLFGQFPVQVKAE